MWQVTLFSTSAFRAAFLTPACGMSSEAWCRRPERRSLEILAGCKIHCHTQSAAAPGYFRSSAYGSRARRLILALACVLYRMLFWNEYELVEFFGVLPEVHEDSGSYTFRVEKDGLRLEVALFPDTDEFLQAGEVYIALFQAGREEPIFFTKIKGCPGFKYVTYPNGWECLEVAAPARNIFMEEEWIVPMGARIRVNPVISVELFQSEAG